MVVETVSLYDPLDIYIDSGTLNNKGSLDYPKFDLEPSIRNAEGFSVVSVSVPFTYNIIDAVSNVITITVAGSDTVFTVYIPPGTYTSAQFVTVFNNAITVEYDPLYPWDGGVSAVGGSDAFDALSDTYGLSVYDYSLSSKFTFYTLKVATTVSFTMDFGGARSAYAPLGFLQTSYTAQSGVILLANGSEANSGNPVYYVEPPNTYQMTGPGYIYIFSELATSVKDGAVRTEKTLSQLLHGIPASNNYKGYTTYNCDNPVRIPFSKTTVNKLDFYLQLGQKTSYCPGSDFSYYSSGQPITTNYLQLMGQPWQIKIRFFYRGETVMNYMSMGPDKFIQAESQQATTGKPSEEHYDKKHVKPDAKFRKFRAHPTNGGITSSHMSRPEAIRKRTK